MMPLINMLSDIPENMKPTVTRSWILFGWSSPSFISISRNVFGQMNRLSDNSLVVSVSICFPASAQPYSFDPDLKSRSTFFPTVFLLIDSSPEREREAFFASHDALLVFSPLFVMVKCQQICIPKIQGKKFVTLNMLAALKSNLPSHCKI